MEVFLLSRAVKSNMIYSDRAGFLDEMNRLHQRQQMAEVFLSLINNNHHEQIPGPQAKGAGAYAS